jgi:hypothetical protein
LTLRRWRLRFSPKALAPFNHTLTERSVHSTPIAENNNLLAVMMIQANKVVCYTKSESINVLTERSVQPLLTFPVKHAIF